MGSYFGLQENLGDSKTKIFISVQKRLQNRINGCLVKLLSKEGKKVLIKSVASA